MSCRLSVLWVLTALSFGSCAKKVYAVRPAQKPYISQVYAGATNDKFVEVKNKDNTTAIGSGQYFLALYANGAPTIGAPTSFIDLGAIPANGVTVFRANATANPSYAVASATIMPLLENYDGTTDILLITTSTGTNAYNDRIDIIGDNTTHAVFAKDYTQETYASLVRVSCTPMGYPRATYDEQDWVGFSATEVALATSKTNAVLGRHNSDLLKWEPDPLNPGFGYWNDDSIGESNPDRSREISILRNYNTTVSGDFEACSLNIINLITLTITPSHYVKVQIGVNVLPDGQLIVQNEGSLVMVRDCYYGSCGTALINLGANSTLQANRQTVNLSGPYDYVYWSSPLSSNPSNPTAGQIFPFGSGTNQFAPSRFYRFENQNFCDILNIYFPLNGSTDGYDDNFDDYVPFTTLTTAANEQLIPGRGYASWPPVPAASNYNYNISFTGEMNNGVVSVPVFRNNSVSGRNSNLVGNPYPSPIDLDLFFSVNTATIEPIAYIWTRLTDDPNAGIPGPNGLNYTAANFSVYTPNMSLNTESNPVFAGNNVLASGQSFFVRTYKDFTGMTAANPIVTTSLSTPNGQQIAPAGNVLFNNNMRTTAPNITFSRMSTIIEGDKLWVNLTDSTNYTAQLGVYFKPTGHSSFVQNEDAPTIQGRKYNFYTQSTTEDLLIDIQDGFDTNKVIPLGMVNVSDNINQSFTISVPKKGGVFNSQTVYLEDTQLGVLHNLSASNYTFTANSNIVEGRFNLRFTNNIITFTNKSNHLENEIILKVNDDTLFVSSSNKKIQSVQVFDIYTPNTSNLLLNKVENKNTNQVILSLQANTVLLNVRIILEDGTVINKKIKK